MSKLNKKLDLSVLSEDETHEIRSSHINEGINSFKSKISGMDLQVESKVKAPEAVEPIHNYSGTELAEVAVSVYKNNIKPALNNGELEQPIDPGPDTHARRVGERSIQRALIGLRNGGNEGKLSQVGPNGGGNVGKLSPTGDNGDGNISNHFNNYYALTTDMTLEQYTEYINNKFEMKEGLVGRGLGAVGTDVVAGKAVEKAAKPVGEKAGGHVGKEAGKLLGKVGSTAAGPLAPLAAPLIGAATGKAGEEIGKAIGGQVAGKGARIAVDAAGSEVGSRVEDGVTGKGKKKNEEYIGTKFEVNEADMTGAPSIKNAKPRTSTPVKVYDTPRGKEVLPTIEPHLMNMKASYIADLEGRLLQLEDSAWQSIDIVMRAVAAEVGTTPKQLHKEFKAHHGMIPDDWLRENREVEEAGWMPLAEAARLNPAGVVYELSLMFRGGRQRFKFLWPNMEMPTEEDMQMAAQKFYPFAKLLAYYPADIDNMQDYNGQMVAVPAMSENYIWYNEDDWVDMSEELSQIYEMICSEEGEPIDAPELQEDGFYHLAILDHDTGEKRLVRFGEGWNMDTSDQGAKLLNKMKIQKRQEAERDKKKPGYSVSKGRKAGGRVFPPNISMKEEDDWIQDANKSIEERGTEGKCTPITKPGCTGKAKALAKTFKKMAKNK